MPHSPIPSLRLQSERLHKFQLTDFLRRATRLTRVSPDSQFYVQGGIRVELSFHQVCPTFHHTRGPLLADLVKPGLAGTRSTFQKGWAKGFLGGTAICRGSNFSQGPFLSTYGTLIRHTEAKAWNFSTHKTPFCTLGWSYRSLGTGQ